MKSLLPNRWRKANEWAGGGGLALLSAHWMPGFVPGTLQPLSYWLSKQPHEGCLFSQLSVNAL